MSTVLGNMWGLQAGFVEAVDEALTFPVVVTPGNEELALSWDLQTGVQFYRVWCGLSPDRLVLVADGVTDPGYTISGLLSGQQYFVQVTGVVTPRLSIASVTGDVATQTMAYIPTAAAMGTVQFSTDNYADVPGAAPTDEPFTVTRTGDTSLAASVHYATSDGTLIAGLNYTATSGTLNWDAGDGTDKTFDVPYILAGADGQFFNLALSAPSGVELGSPGTATFTLHDV